MYRQGRNYENLNKGIFDGTGIFDIPCLLLEHTTANSFIGFNYAKTCRQPYDKGLHFFVDDYQFSRVWSNPDAYLDMLRKFKVVCTPDFSTYTDFPKAIQIYNHYRKHWLGAYWQENGITVIPTVSWSDRDSFSKRQNLTLTWWNRPKYKDYDGIICDGSIRSGKTVSMTDGFVLWSMSSFNGQNFAICGKTIESLRRNVITLMPQWLEGIFTITERRSENKLIITAGNKTNYYYLFGGKDESSYTLVQGITLAGVLFDEVALMPRSFVEQAMARCSVDGSKFWFNCNPESPGHWFYVEWIKKAKERNILYLHFTMNDNLSLSKRIRERYEGMYSGVFYRRYILGLWVKAEGLVYPMFDRNAHIVRNIPDYSPRHRYYVAVDYGTVNPFAAGLYDYSPAEQKAVMIKELYHKGGSNNRVDNEAYYKMLSELIGDYPIEYIIIDPSASSMIETIQKYGEYAVVKADNDVLNGIQDVTKFLNAGVLYFHRGCKSTFEEFETYSWDEDSVEDAVIKENDHSMDQIRYFCRTALRNELKWIV